MKAHAAALALFGCLIFTWTAYAQSRDPREPEHSEQQQVTVQTRTESKNNPSAATAFVASTPQPEVGKEPSPQAAAKNEQALKIVLQKDVADYGLILFSGALVLVSGLQVLWLRRTALANRPHVTFANFEAHDFIGLLDQRASNQPYVQFGLRNVGQSPAFIREYAFRVRYFENGTPPQPEYGSPIKLPEGAAALAPKETGRPFWQRRDLEEAPLTPDKVIALRQGQVELLFYGFILYRDVFRINHESRFCLKYNPNDKLFYFGGPSAYHKYT